MTLPLSPTERQIGSDGIDWSKGEVGKDTVIMLHVDGRVYEFHFYQGCHTCNAGDDTVDMIHSMAAKGFLPREIFRETDNGEFSFKSLNNHLSKHVPGLSLHQKFLLAAHRSGVGVPVDGVPDSVTSEMTLRAALTMGTKDLVSGDMEMKPGDLLSAAKMVREIEKENVHRDQAALFGEAARIIMDAARASMSESDYNALVWNLQTNDRIKAIMHELQGGGSPQPDSEPEVLPPPPREISFVGDPVAEGRIL